jgi:hypothetical protein
MTERKKEMRSKNMAENHKEGEEKKEIGGKTHL